MHVLVKFFCLLMLAIALVYLNVQQLIWLSAALVIAALMVDANTWLGMLRRVRWLLLVLMLMYGFSTPGEYVSFWKLPLRPTYEGLMLGFKQLLTMVMMLAGLSLVLATTSRSVLIGGLYQLMLPLRCLRLDAERFAVRIWLTLYYAEIRKQAARPLQKTLDFKELFAFSETASPSDFHDRINIEVNPLRRRDYVLMLLMALYLLALRII